MYKLLNFHRDPFDLEKEEKQNMAVIIDGMRNKTDRYSCPTCSTITWLLLCIALVMDGNVPLVRSQFIFREDPLGRNVPCHKANSSLAAVTLGLGKRYKTEKAGRHKHTREPPNDINGL
uniref:Uncharacterized protein n=1 Tax=Daphnia galeata TaxID=27404 RepID=A0A8J2RZ25_9CRUS|nr:unnamed protein product [Daphnia galeata]